ncbi:MAG TPA: hypothetical protein VJO53_00145 [Candidatus Acidoferrales bacterium]|nr:hypothetical protein [Candidatus Acidoferrales bacterium]
MTRRGIALLSVAAALQIVHPAAEAKTLARIPHARQIFGVSASPKRGELILYASDDTPDGEVRMGYPVLVLLDGNQSTSKRLCKAEIQDDYTYPAWSPDGDRAYFICEDGVHILNARTGESHVLRAGSFAGLAINLDGTKIAYWNLNPPEHGKYELVVLDPIANKELRTWTLENLFSSDQYGFEVAFGSRGQSLLARTYDTEGATPLKEFSLTTGGVNTVLDDCAALAPAENAVYLIHVMNETRTLMKISPDSREPIAVVPNFTYSKIAAEGSIRWILAQNFRKKRVAVIDTSDDSIRSFDKGCDAATVMANGDLVFAARGSLLSSASDCAEPTSVK